MRLSPMRREAERAAAAGALKLASPPTTINLPTNQPLPHTQTGKMVFAWKAAGITYVLNTSSAPLPSGPRGPCGY
jgi:hypothetical protein